MAVLRLCWLHEYRNDSIVQPKGEEEVEKEHILGCTLCTIRMKGPLACHLLTVAQGKRLVTLHLSVKRLQYDCGVLYYACDIGIARQDSGMGGGRTKTAHYLGKNFGVGHLS